jgi:MbtH protein
MWNDNEAAFFVVRNEENQYSIWPCSLKIPEGWLLAGYEGKRSDCLSYIDTTWTDMRPASLIREQGV